MGAAIFRDPPQGPQSLWFLGQCLSSASASRMPLSSRSNLAPRMSPFVPQLLAQARSWLTSSCLLSANLYPQRTPGDTGQTLGVFVCFFHPCSSSDYWHTPVLLCKSQPDPFLQADSLACLEFSPVHKVVVAFGTYAQGGTSCTHSSASTPGSLDTPRSPISALTTTLMQGLEGRHCFPDRKGLPKCQLSEWAGGEPALHEMGPLHPGDQEARTSGGQGGSRCTLGDWFPMGSSPRPAPLPREESHDPLTPHPRPRGPTQFLFPYTRPVPTQEVGCEWPHLCDLEQGEQLLEMWPGWGQGLQEHSHPSLGLSLHICEREQ